MKTWQKLLVGVLAILVAVALYLFLQLRSIAVERLSEDLWVLRGLGGNTAVYRTEVGAVVVDTMTLPMQGARIRAVARDLTGLDTAVLINTHYHLDHTHGNPAFEPGIEVYSTDRTLAHLKTLDPSFWRGKAEALLPNETFETRRQLQIGGKQIELYHPGPGHTDGDLVVLFSDERVIHMGDLLVKGHYPNIDLEAGGSVRQWSDTLDQVLAMEFDRAIPGHGATTDGAGVAQFRSFMAQLARIGDEAAENGLTLEQTLAEASLTADAGYEPIKFIVPLGLDRNFVITRAWEEATGNFELTR